MQSVFCSVKINAIKIELGEKELRLSAENISFEINGKQILHNVSYAFAEGKRTGIIGSNGAGKSTLLKILCLLTKKFTGMVTIDGEDIKNINRNRLAQMIAILPQEKEVPADVTVRQLTSYGRFPHRSIFKINNPKEDRDAIDWALKVTQLNELAERQISTLSGGERQRAWLSMVLAQRPQILLLDEPTTYLDIRHQLEVMKIISEVNRSSSMTIIMVLHDINHARLFTDDVIIIKDRQIFTGGNPKEILTEDVIGKVFGIEADTFTNKKGDSVIMPLMTFNNSSEKFLTRNSN